jgi:chemotaxis protein CheD
VTSLTSGENGSPGRPRRVRVGVGDLAVVDDDATLTTSGLGSCVAVAMADRHAGVRGLLHAMLPSAARSRPAAPRPGKYVDSGIDALCTALVDAGAAATRLDAQLIGGAELLDLTAAVGPQNVERARERLTAASIPIVASDVGADVGRTVRFVAGGEVVVRAADGFERTIE